MGSQGTKDIVHCLDVLFERPGEQGDVVKVHVDCMAKVRTEDCVHVPLERGRCIAQALRQDRPLKKPKWSFARGFVNVLLLHRDLTIRLGEINFPANTSALGVG